ncbi:unnamed protein product [Chrysodeixis includens]|uniref:Acyltransferase 3 domain-containing protein n=1 Tax=Chrysodeixis includens TaxID=689277 RepID=A0A9P0BWX5_CHRIL|nr:unnamed protein product [Chrysodeixis includens]
MQRVLLLLLLAPALAHARDVTDEEYSQFPRLFQLDDYESCLARPGGLYCLGSFTIAPLSHPSPLYNTLKEYSEDVHHFNRTELHRGYCVSARCASLAGERNASRRFERCVAARARRHSLHVSLHALSYCRTHAQEYARQHSSEPMDVPQKLFLTVLAGLLAMNVIGTAYDLLTDDNDKKLAALSVWSVRDNWRRLTAHYTDGDPRISALSPVQGIRVLLMLLIMAAHSGCIQDALYIYNPRWVEQISHHPALMFFLNGTSVVQLFITLSNFLLAYNLLLFSKVQKLSFRMLPYIAIKRIARISPVYLLVVGYAATWWASAGSGPLWPAVVGAESEACRRKFWTHALFLNNLVDPEDICLVQTWFLAVDTQLYAVAAVLTVYLSSRRERALPVLAGLVAASSLLNGLLAYVFDWKSLMYIAYPSTLRTMYRGVPSFARLYEAPWGSLPPCLVGLFFAFLHFELQEAGVKVSSYKWLRLPYHAAPVLTVSWIMSGHWVRAYSAPWFVAAYVALERPLLSGLCGIVMFGIFNGLEGWLKSLFAWRGWQAMGRMSLAVLAVHWCVNMFVAASTHQPVHASLLSVIMDWLATSCFSYALAIPLTVMVEMPAQRFVTALMM